VTASRSDTMITDLVRALAGHRSPRREGVLTLGGIDVRDLAAEHGTPLLVARRGRPARAVPRVAAAFDGWPGGADVAYAGKAFLSRRS